MSTRFSDSDGHKHCCSAGCFSWSAVIAGAIVAIGLGFLLNLFGATIGATLFSASNQEASTAGSVGGFIGMLVGVIIVTFIGGLVAGRLGQTNCSRRHFGALYGFTTWCLSLIFGIILATQVGQIVGLQLGALGDKVTTINITGTSVKATTDEQRKGNVTGTTGSKHIEISNDRAAKVAATSLALTFFLFLIGALSSIIGGIVGSKKCKDKEFENR